MMMEGLSRPPNITQMFVVKVESAMPVQLSFTCTGDLGVVTS